MATKKELLKQAAKLGLDGIDKTWTVHEISEAIADELSAREARKVSEDTSVDEEPVKPVAVKPTMPEPVEQPEPTKRLLLGKGGRFRCLYGITLNGRSYAAGDIVTLDAKQAERLMRPNVAAVEPA